MSDYISKINLYVFYILISLILIGSLINYEGHKFSSIMKNKYPQCRYGMVDLITKDEIYCCDVQTNENQWLCNASRDLFTRFFSSFHSIYIPLIPAIFTIGLDFFNRKTLHLTFQSLTKISSFRIICYLGIIFIRMFLLYYFPYELSKSFEYNSPLKCWCKDLVSESKCKLAFDFSDHIVLYIVQYMLPSLLELSYILTRLSNNPKMHYTSYLLPILLIVCLHLVLFRSMLFTSIYFHSPIENIVALIIGSCFFFPILCTTKGEKLWDQITSI